MKCHVAFERRFEIETPIVLAVGAASHGEMRLTSEAFNPYQQRYVVTRASRTRIEGRMRPVGQVIGGDDRVVCASEEGAAYGSRSCIVKHGVTGFRRILCGRGTFECLAREVGIAGVALKRTPGSRQEWSPWLHSWNREARRGRCVWGRQSTSTLPLDGLSDREEAIEE
jgi:hypothetical protein